jgi:hypothetical protein
MFSGNLNSFNGLNDISYNYTTSFKEKNKNQAFLAILNMIKTSIYANSSLGKSFMQNISFQLSDMLLSCVYNGISCDSSNFIEFTTYDRGNCYMFNSNTSSIKTSTQSGPFFGLQLELFAGFDGNIYFLNILY